MEEYIIPLKGLEKGKQEMLFNVGREFIACFNDEEISNSDVKVLVNMIKTGQVFELNFSINGMIQIPCDRCLEDVNLNVQESFNLYLKYGEEFAEIDDEVIIIPREEGYFDLSGYIYEFIRLSLPIAKVHSESECNPEMITRLKTQKQKKEKETDPRWEALKKISNN